MQIIQTVSVKIGYTFNLGDYSNIRPEVMLSSDIGVGDNTQTALNVLKDEALKQCYAIIDQALEDNDQPAKYSGERRYVAYRFHDEQVFVVLPMDSPDRKHPSIKHAYRFRNYEGYRRDHLLRLLHKTFPDHATVETPLSDLQPIAYMELTDNAYTRRGLACLVIGQYVQDAFERDMPEYLKILTEHRTVYKYMRPSTFDDWVHEQPLPVIDITMPDWEDHPTMQTLKAEWEDRQRNKEAAASDIPFDDDDDEEEDDE